MYKNSSKEGRKVIRTALVGWKEPKAFMHVSAMSRSSVQELSCLLPASAARPDEKKSYCFTMSVSLRKGGARGKRGEYSIGRARMGGGQGAQLVGEVCLAPLEVGQTTDGEGLQKGREHERHLASPN